MPLPGESPFSTDLPLETINTVRPPLPGRAWIQTLLMLYFLLALGSALFVIPFSYIRDGMRAAGVAPLAMGVTLVDLILLTGTTWLINRIIGISGSGDAQALGVVEVVEKLLLALLLASVVLSVGLVHGVLQQLNNRDFLHFYYVAVALAGALFPFFFAYWWWLPTPTQSKP